MHVNFFLTLKIRLRTFFYTVTIAETFLTAPHLESGKILSIIRWPNAVSTGKKAHLQMIAKLLPNVEKTS